MQAAETVYEFGSSPDEEDDITGQSSPNKASKKQHSQSNKINQPTSIAGTNLRPNKTSSTSINQKFNTSFGSISDTHQSRHSPNPRNNPSSVSHHSHVGSGNNDETTAISDQSIHGGPKSDRVGASNLVGSVGNASNTSLSSTTNSSRGNVSQSGNQSMSVSSQKSLGHQASSSSQQQNPNFDSNVISERVKNLATQIYQELKRIISRCNYDEDVLSGLMPLIVRVLESLDLALIENQQLQVELELCKDDNEQLVIMLEKEKAAKRSIDKRLIESEYSYEEERQQYQQKIESLDNIVKMFELKAKNASDQAARFEEKEAERKKEYNKLHDRYTELLKSHCDVVERVRHLIGNAEVATLGSMNVAQQMVASSPELTIGDVQSHQTTKIRLKPDLDSDKGTAMRARDTLKSWNAETELTLEDASLVVIEEMLEPNKAAEAPGHNESDRTTSEPDGEHEKESENDSIAYTSMEKEFRKLIQENKDLLNTKNALNVVKDDLIAEVDRLTNEVSMYEQAVEQLNSTKDQMKQKVSTLDAELRKTKEELEKAKQKIRESNEEGEPFSQRKRFNRAEMAKVLMERNNYKERYMELQDAVRYTELVRANKVETEKRSGLWKFFSNLFGAQPREIAAIGSTSHPILATSRNSSPVVSYHGCPATSSTMSDQQAGSGSNQFIASDALQSGAVLGASLRSTNQRLSSNSDLIVLMDSDLNVDRSRALKEGTWRLSSEMPGYINAYGWSLPTSSVRFDSEDEASDLSMQKVPAILGSTSSYPSTEAQSQNDACVNKLSGLRVPIPQHCRPLSGDLLGMKIWCATTIDMSGGDMTTARQLSQPTERLESQAQDPESSGSIVNISASSTLDSPARNQAVERLEHEIDRALIDKLDDKPVASLSNPGSTQKPLLKATTEIVLGALPIADSSEELSTCVWICSAQHSRSKITIIDIKTKPNELLDSFYVPTFLYCIKSIPGFKSIDLPGINSANEPDKKCAALQLIGDLILTQKRDFYKLIRVDLDSDHNPKRELTSLNESDQKLRDDDGRTKAQAVDDDAEISRILDNNISDGIVTLQKLNDFVAHSQPQHLKGQSPHSPQIFDDSQAYNYKDVIYYQPISTSLSTVWMGGKDSILYIHSAIGQWKDCVACVKLRDSILQICHFRGRVFVALADGSLCIFFRNADTNQWEFSQYLSIDINLMADATVDFTDLPEINTCSSSNELVSDLPISFGGAQVAGTRGADTARPSSHFNSKQRNKTAGIRCLEIANKNLWIGYRNRVLIIDPTSLKLKHTFYVVPQVDNQIRQLVSMKDGVFCCLRSDLILRLYSSLKPYQHIQNIDVEPVVTRLISPKTFVISHITAMKVIDNTLWLGNAHGIILTIPCKLVPQISEAPTSSELDNVDQRSSSLSIARFVPKCDINNARISFHGHKDAVKFFISAHNLVMSGGQGYLDFRLDMDEQTKSISDKSHLILWQLPH